MLSVTSKLVSFLCLTCEGHHEPETWKRHHHPHKVRMFGFFAVMYYYYGQIVIPYTMCINCVNKLLSKLKFFTFFFKLAYRMLSYFVFVKTSCHNSNCQRAPQFASFFAS